MYRLKLHDSQEELAKVQFPAHPELIKTGFTFSFEGENYKILSVHYFADKVVFNDKGYQTGDNLTPKEFSERWPIIVVTTVPDLSKVLL